MSQSRAARSAAAKKAARTRKRNARLKIAAGKKAARTRKRAAGRKATRKGTSRRISISRRGTSKKRSASSRSPI